MKMVKKSITLSEDLFEFAEKEAGKLAKQRGEKQNISAYVRMLLLEQMSPRRIKQAA